MSDCPSGRCEVGSNANRIEQEFASVYCSNCGWHDGIYGINQETLEDEKYHDLCPKCKGRLFIKIKGYVKRGFTIDGCNCRKKPKPIW